MSAAAVPHAGPGGPVPRTSLTPPSVVATAGAFVVAGAGMILFANYHAWGTIDTARQTRWGALGVLGTALVCLGVTYGVMRARYAVLARVHRLSDDLPGWPAAAAEPASAASSALVASTSMRRYHRSGCELTAGKQVHVASRAGHEAAGRRACGVCGA